MIRVETLVAPIGDADWEQLMALHLRSFPRPDRDLEEFRQRMRTLWQGELRPHAGPAVRFITRHDGRIVANATLIPREILTSKGKMTIAGLSSVSSDPDCRGQGFGRAVVVAVFDCVDAGEFPFSLFQTGQARPFYEKLGCALVTNPIVNSLDTSNLKENPFWDQCAMRYPASGRWPEGEIDLLGKGY